MCIKNFKNFKDEKERTRNIIVLKKFISDYQKEGFGTLNEYLNVEETNKLGNEQLEKIKDIITENEGTNFQKVKKILMVVKNENEQRIAISEATIAQNTKEINKKQKEQTEVTNDINVYKSKLDSLLEKGETASEAEKRNLSAQYDKILSDLELKEIKFNWLDEEIKSLRIQVKNQYTGMSVIAKKQFVHDTINNQVMDSVELQEIVGSIADIQDEIEDTNKAFDNYRQESLNASSTIDSPFEKALRNRQIKKEKDELQKKDVKDRL